MPGLLSKERITAPPSFNRWLVPPASVAIHLCIGSVYAWSIYNPPLIRVFGVVTPAADDWLLSDVVWIFTVAIVFLGLSAALAGKWLEDVGPRMVGTVAAACWGGGYLIGGLGIYLHELWLVYLGYGVDRRLRLGVGLRLAREHADSLVPRPPRHGDRHGDHGLRRRRDHRRAAQAFLHPHVLRGAAVSRAAWTKCRS